MGRKNATKKFRCPVDGCTKSGNASSSIMQHVRTIHPWLDRKRALMAMQADEVISDPAGDRTPASRDPSGFWRGVLVGIASSGIVAIIVAGYYFRAHSMVMQLSAKMW